MTYMKSLICRYFSNRIISILFILYDLICSFHYSFQAYILCNLPRNSHALLFSFNCAHSTPYQFRATRHMIMHSTLYIFPNFLLSSLHIIEIVEGFFVSTAQFLLFYIYNSDMTVNPLICSFTASKQ